MLEIAHEIVVTRVKSYQPYIDKCTYTQVPFILSRANNCCSQASQPFVKHVLVETYDDSITKENEELKEEIKNGLDSIEGKVQCSTFLR
jgi:hypothetical protein